MNGFWRKTEPGDAEFLNGRLRDEDVREVLALGANPRNVLSLCASGSEESYTGFLKGEVAMMFGVSVPLWQEGAMIWALGSDLCNEHPRELLVHGRELAKDFSARYGLIWNYCDARYARSLRWLRKIGFTVSEPVPYGAQGEPFCRLEMRSV